MKYYPDAKYRRQQQSPTRKITTTAVAQLNTEQLGRPHRPQLQRLRRSSSAATPTASTKTYPADLFPDRCHGRRRRIIQKNYMRNFVRQLHQHALADHDAQRARRLCPQALLSTTTRARLLPSRWACRSRIDTAGYLPMFPNISTGGYVTLGNGDHRKNAFMTYSLTGEYHQESRAPHTIKAGWEGRMIRVNSHEYRNTAGIITVSPRLSRRDQPKHRQFHSRKRLRFAPARHGRQRQPDPELQRCRLPEFLSRVICPGRYSRFRRLTSIWACAMTSIRRARTVTIA